MAKEFITVTVRIQYEVDPDLYPGAGTPAERAEIDRKNFTEDPQVLVDTLADKGAKSISVGSFTIG